MTSPPNPPAPAAKLEPCPFCGVADFRIYQIDEGNRGWFIDCNTCWIDAGPFETEAELRELWNVRIPQSALRAEIAKAKADGEALAERLKAAEEAIVFLPNHGCFDGDCPHINTANCIESLRKCVVEFAQEVAQSRRSRSAPTASETEAG